MPEQEPKREEPGELLDTGNIGNLKASQKRPAEPSEKSSDEKEPGRPEPTPEEIEAFAKSSGFGVGQRLKVKLLDKDFVPTGEPEPDWEIYKFNPHTNSVFLSKEKEGHFIPDIRVVSPEELKEWNETKPETPIGVGQREKNKEAFDKSSGFEVGQTVRAKKGHGIGESTGEAEGGWVIDGIYPYLNLIKASRTSDSGRIERQAFIPEELEKWDKAAPEQKQEREERGILEQQKEEKQTDAEGEQRQEKISKLVVPERYGEPRTKEQQDNLKRIMEVEGLRRRRRKGELLSTVELTRLPDEERPVVKKGFQKGMESTREEILKAEEEAPEEKTSEPAKSTLLQEEENLKSVLEGFNLEKPQEFLFDKEKYRKIAKAYTELGALYNNLTKEDLTQKIKDKAKEEVEKLGGKVMTKKEYFGREHQQEVFKKTAKYFWGRAIVESWKILPEREKRGFENNVVNYAKNLREKRKKLEERGTRFDSYVWYELLSFGYRPQDIEQKRGWKEKLFGREAQVVLPSLREASKPMVLRIDKFEKWKEELKKNAVGYIKSEAERRLRHSYDMGKQRLFHIKAEIGGKILTALAADQPSSPPEESRSLEKEESATLEKEKTTARVKRNSRLAKLNLAVAKAIKEIGLEKQERMTLLPYLAGAKTEVPDGLSAEMKSIIEGIVNTRSGIVSDFEKEIKAAEEKKKQRLGKIIDGIKKRIEAALNPENMAA